MINKERRRLKDFIPSNARWFLADLLGIDKTFTEEDLTESELQYIISRLKDVPDYTENFEEGERRAISFYGNTDKMQNEEGQFTLKDIIKSSFKNPQTSLQTALGKAALTQNEKGEFVIEDKYDFDLASRDFGEVTTRELLKTLISREYDIGDFLYQFSGRFGSRPGSGNPVRINLGKLLND
jgi:hypothetical protein